MVPYGTQPCVQQAGDLPTLGPTFSMANHIPTIVQVNPGSLTQEATPGAIVIGYDNEGIPIYHQPALGQVWTLLCYPFQKLTLSKLVAFHCAGGLVCLHLVKMESKSLVLQEVTLLQQTFIQKHVW